MSTKLVIHPAGGLPPARTLITNFVLSLFLGLDMLYIGDIYTDTLDLVTHPLLAGRSPPPPHG